MAGTREGGRKTAQTNKERHGEDFYRRIGKKGGSNSHTGGFASQTVGKDGLTGAERAKIAGAKGGSKSRRGASKHPKQSQHPKQSHCRLDKINSTRELYNVLKSYIITPKEN